jgi:DNA-binding XRE family transcriptional regulator
MTPAMSVLRRGIILTRINLSGTKKHDKMVKGAFKKEWLAAGYTRRQLADILDVSETSLSRWNACTNVPTLYYLKKMAEAFNCSLDHLLLYF